MTPFFSVSCPTIITHATRRTVPNQFPLLEPNEKRIAICGETPGEQEENHGVPFIGASGQLLEGLLRDTGIERSKCFVGNVCQYRPAGNDISRFDWNGSEIQQGLVQLQLDLLKFRPNILILLGNAALHAAKTGTTPPPRKKGGYDWPYAISSWCSSLFFSPTFSVKCIAGFHPAGILRQWGSQGNYPRLRHTLERASRESTTPSLVLPQRDLTVPHDASHICYMLDTWPAGQRCSVDIEGGLPTWRVNLDQFTPKERRHLGWRCVSLSANPSRAFTIAWWKFNEDEHMAILLSFARLMSRWDVPKVLQNALYDTIVLAYGYDIHVSNVAEDTMLKGWEVYCELPKGLSCQASIYTREPHWKDDEMYESTGESLAIGCARDAAVTLEICEVQDGILDGTEKEHYRANESMLNPLRYMELRGIRYDKDQVAKKLKEVRQTGWWEADDDEGKSQTWHDPIRVITGELERVAGHSLVGPSGCLADKRLAYCLYQRDPGSTPKGKARPKIEWRNAPYPPQWKKEGGRNTTETTTNVEALLNLRKKSGHDPFLNGILRHRHLEGLIETLNIVPDPDGRVRCGYNVVGTETGRLTCYTSPTGAGANLTTITKSLRGNYIADPGYDFWQADLEGADSWTVACHAARLGDRTMLEDLYAGLKPAKILCLLYLFGAQINTLSRDDLKFWTSGDAWKAVEEEIGKGFYDCAKATVHGSNYMMGIPTLILNILLKSYKYLGEPIYLEHCVASTLQFLYFSRYPGVKTWHMWGASQLRAHGTLTSASGQTREFFGRRFGDINAIKDTVKELLAHEPQSNTTWATNLAMLRLWNDPSNRLDHIRPQDNCAPLRLVDCAGSWQDVPPEAESFVSHLSRGSLLVEPLHTVHDALCGQWPQFLREWARNKVRQWFDNSLTIAGTKLVIPFDGGYGRSWGELENKL